MDTSTHRHHVCKDDAELHVHHAACFSDVKLMVLPRGLTTIVMNSSLPPPTHHYFHIAARSPLSRVISTLRQESLASASGKCDLLFLVSAQFEVFPLQGPSGGSVPIPALIKGWVKVRPGRIEGRLRAVIGAD